MELEFASAKSDLECGDELTAENTAEHFDGKKKGVVGGDPASVVRSEAAGGDHTGEQCRLILAKMFWAKLIGRAMKVATEMLYRADVSADG